MSQGIDPNKTSGSKECHICHYRYFLDTAFKFQPYVYNGCDDLTQNAMSPYNVAIFSFKENDYRIHFCYMSRDEAINLSRNADLTEESRKL